MLSTVHQANDVRIAEKEARSLAAAGHEVTVIARSPGLADRPGFKTRFIELPRLSRWKRPWIAGRAASTLAKAENTDVVHIHDPELIPFALWLKRTGCKIVYDVHEDVPRDIYSKTWIPKLAQPPVAKTVEAVERLTAKRFDAIVAATPSIADRFRSYGARVSLVRNTVQPDRFVSPRIDEGRIRRAVYIGHISFNRGLREMVEACDIAGLPLTLAGNAGAAEQSWMQNHSGKPEWRGRLDRSEIGELLSTSFVGLCLFHLEPNHLHAMPTKLFEYMAAGLPIVSSDLPMSRKIVESADCGLIASPLNSRAVAEALQVLLANPARARAMGSAGRSTAIRDYNWNEDAAVLGALYADLAADRRRS